MNAAAERRLLQGAVALAALVPLTAGAMGMIEGPAMLRGVGTAAVDLDSHFRYLSGLLAGIGLGFASCIPAIERRSARFRLLGLIVVLGGLARLGSLIGAGAPGPGHMFGLAMELAVVPMLMFWQARVARRVKRAEEGSPDSKRAAGSSPGGPSTWSAAGSSSPEDLEKA